MFDNTLGYRNSALTDAIRKRRSLQPNNAPQGFGQPNGSGFKDMTSPEPLSSDTYTAPTVAAPQAAPQAQPSAPERTTPPAPGPQNTGINGGATGGINGSSPKGPVPMPGLTADMTPEQTHAAVQAYYDQRGVKPLGARGNTPGSVDYWTQKAPELIARGKELDPASDGTFYLNGFLAHADEFGGGGPFGNGTGTGMEAAPNPHAGMNTFNNPTLRSAILPGATADPGFFTNQSALSRIQALLSQMPKIGGAR